MLKKCKKIKLGSGIRDRIRIGPKILSIRPHKILFKSVNTFLRYPTDNHIHTHTQTLESRYFGNFVR